MKEEGGTPDIATKDGYDVQIQTNHLSHFLLTAELLPLIEKEAEENGDARVVNHSSKARMTLWNGLEEKYFMKNGGNLGGDGGNVLIFMGARFTRYAHSKLANVVFGQGLHTKLCAKKNSKVRVVSCDPGASKTSLMEGMPMGGLEGKIVAFLSDHNLQSAEDGSMSLLLAMMGSKVISGEYYAPKMLKGRTVLETLARRETNPDSIDMLWKRSEEATGVTFTI